MILPIQYEPKVENRWSVILPDNFNIYGFLCFATERPKIKYEFDDSGNPYKISYEPIVLKIYDPIKPSSTKKIYDLFISDIQKINKFDYTLQLLNPMGDTIEKWLIIGCNVLKIDFGDLDYKSDKKVYIEILVKPDNVILEF